MQAALFLSVAIVSFVALDGNGGVIRSDSLGDSGGGVLSARVVDHDCDRCVGVVNFKVVRVPPGTWPFNPANVVFGGVWDDAASVAGQCAYDPTRRMVGHGCSDSIITAFGYNGPGHVTYDFSIPPNSAVGAATVSDPNSMQWQGVACGSWGASRTPFTIYYMGVQVALVEVKGGCRTCDDKVPPMW